MHYYKNSQSRLCDGFVWVCRIWGILTAIGSWGVAIETVVTTSTNPYIGYHFMFTALWLSILESIFVVHIFLLIMIRHEKSCCMQIWSRLFWLDNWKKGILYFVLSIPFFLHPKQLWLAMIPGVMLLMAAVLYTLKSLKYRHDKIQAEERTKQQTYNRFSTPDDDSIIDGLTTVRLHNHCGRETLIDQEEILEV